MLGRKGRRKRVTPIVEFELVVRGRVMCLFTCLRNGDAVNVVERSTGIVLGHYETKPTRHPYHEAREEAFWILRHVNKAALWRFIDAHNKNPA